MTYDPKYSTKVAFNTPIMISMLKERDMDKVMDWFDNGEPNKKLATAALETFIRMQWIEPLNILWQKDWLSQKGMITVATNYMIGLTLYGREPDFIGSDSEKWIFEKINSTLSKAQKNALSLSVLDLCLSNKNPHYWNVFYSDDLVLKGRTSEKIISSLVYHLEQENTEYNNYDESRKLSMEQLDQVLNNKNGFQVEGFLLSSILINHKKQNIELFLKIIESHEVIINQKDLFVLATKTALFFKSAFSMYKNYEEKRKQYPDFMNTLFIRIIKAYIKAGLPEKVKFTIKDLEDEYTYSFQHGSITIYNETGSNDSRHAAWQLPNVETGHYARIKDKIKEQEFNTGVALFSEFKKADNGYDMRYYPPTETEEKEMIERFEKLKDDTLNSLT